LTNEGRKDIKKGQCWVRTNENKYNLSFVELEDGNRASEHTLNYFSISSKKDKLVRGYINTNNNKITIYFKADNKLIWKNYSWVN